MSEKFKSPLHQMAMTTPTQFWNDSSSVEELTYAIGNGAVGATSNPPITLNVLKKEMHLWKDYIQQTVREHPDWSETRISWQIFESIAANGAKLLLPVFEQMEHKRGRLSIQTDPANFAISDAILHQAVYFNTLGENMQVKIPVTKAGIAAIEEATYQGVNINATVSFTVPQVVAVGAAVERGLKRREAEGKDVSTMSPVCTLMVGRTDDWIKVLAKKNNVTIDPEYLEWPGVACFKKGYEIYQQRGYRTRLLSAAYRNFYHWTEFVGGNVTLTLPYEWQLKFNASDVKIEDRMQIPVKPEIIDALYGSFPDFRRAYDVDGMAIDEFDSYGATVRTLRSFIGAWHDLVAVIRDFILPDPDK